MKNIRVISPAGSIDPAVLEGGVRTLAAWGHHVTVAPHAAGRYGRYAGTPADRATDLIEALQDPEVDIIWCSRGGYGCMHLFDFLSPELVSECGKWLVGYSDVTALHALWQRAGVRSLHAPMMKHLGEVPEHATSLAIREWLEGDGAAPELRATTHDCNIPGSAEGRLAGGNLAVLSGLHGTPYDFDYQDALLFIEDIGESPYKIDRMMQTLRLSGALRGLKGLIVGQFTGYDEDKLMPQSLSETIRQTVLQATGGNIPVCFNAPVGHVTDNYPLVEGARYVFTVTADGARLQAL